MNSWQDVSTLPSNCETFRRDSPSVRVHTSSTNTGLWAEHPPGTRLNEDEKGGWGLKWQWREKAKESQTGRGTVASQLVISISMSNSPADFYLRQKKSKQFPSSNRHKARVGTFNLVYLTEQHFSDILWIIKVKEPHKSLDFSSNQVNIIYTAHIKSHLKVLYNMMERPYNIRMRTQTCTW